jgi:hypothetical protein
MSRSTPPDSSRASNGDETAKEHDHAGYRSLVKEKSRKGCEGEARESKRGKGGGGESPVGRSCPLCGLLRWKPLLHGGHHPWEHSLSPAPLRWMAKSPGIPHRASSVRAQATLADGSACQARDATERPPRAAYRLISAGQTQLPRVSRRVHPPPSISLIRHLHAACLQEGQERASALRTRFNRGWFAQRWIQPDTNGGRTHSYGRQLMPASRSIGRLVPRV